MQAQDAQSRRRERRDVAQGVATQQQSGAGLVRAAGPALLIETSLTLFNSTQAEVRGEAMDVTVELARLRRFTRVGIKRARIRGTAGSRIATREKHHYGTHPTQRGRILDMKTATAPNFESVAGPGLEGQGFRGSRTRSEDSWAPGLQCIESGSAPPPQTAVCRDCCSTHAHPTPLAPNPQPATLNPQPSTLNPQPSSRPSTCCVTHHPTAHPAHASRHSLEAGAGISSSGHGHDSQSLYLALKLLDSLCRNGVSAWPGNAQDGHVAPSTLRPTPYTLILHPTPYTRHPTPYTLNVQDGHAAPSKAQLCRAVSAVC